MIVGKKPESTIDKRITTTSNQRPNLKPNLKSKQKQQTQIDTRPDRDQIKKAENVREPE